MNKGRKPLQDAVIVGDVMDSDALAERSQQLAVMGEMQAAFNRDQYEVTKVISQRVGRSQVLRAFSKVVMAADLEDLLRIKESKQYKGFMYFNPSGKSYSITTWEEYCLHVEGRSVESIDNDLRNYAALGTEGFDALRQLGFGPAKMRELRREGFTDEDRATLIEVAQAGDKETLLDLTEEIIARQRVQRDRQQSEMEKLEKANQRLSGDLQKTQTERDEARDKAALLPRMKAGDKAKAMFEELNTRFADAYSALHQLDLGTKAYLTYAVEEGIEDFDRLLTQQAKESTNKLADVLTQLQLAGLPEAKAHACELLQGVGA